MKKVVGHYISQQYHDQFNSSRKSIYTFTETVQPNRVIYDFYDYDPYQLAANNAKALRIILNKTLTLKSKVPVLFTLVMVQLISFKVLKKEINMLIQFQQNLRYDVLLAKP
ncbi:Uncharacterised protein [Staphylococcus aureus]|uniref:Uncharacterized protein n=1 Tax=Staphylococcus aureus TaxID=1280 RepID=A0A380DZG5_STAAU|nr:Uncharacterised protein [Staphylococcus aureus]